MCTCTEQTFIIPIQGNHSVTYIGIDLHFKLICKYYIIMTIIDNYYVTVCKIYDHIIADVKLFFFFFFFFFLVFIL